MINIDAHFFPEARHVDFMTTMKERSWFANTTNHDAFQTVSNLLPGLKAKFTGRVTLLHETTLRLLRFSNLTSKARTDNKTGI